MLWLSRYDVCVKGVGGYISEDGVPRLNVLDLHKKIREIPKPVIAMVNGYAIGGGHVLHVVCDLTIASDNAMFLVALANLSDTLTEGGVHCMVQNNLDLNLKIHHLPSTT